MSIKSLRAGVERLQPRAFWRPIDRVELPLLKGVAKVRLGGPAETAATFITRIGEHGGFWYAAAGAASMVDRKQAARWQQTALVVVAGYGVSTAVKLIARRNRPPIAAIGTETGLSFPSSHTVTSFAAARMFSYLLPAPARPAVYVLAALFPASRLHFCVHYPSDIAAGAALGDVVGRATVRRWRRIDRQTIKPAVPAVVPAPGPVPPR